MEEDSSLLDAPTCIDARAEDWTLALAGDDFGDDVALERAGDLGVASEAAIETEGECVTEGELLAAPETDFKSQFDPGLAEFDLERAEGELESDKDA